MAEKDSPQDMGLQPGSTDPSPAEVAPQPEVQEIPSSPDAKAPNEARGEDIADRVRSPASGTGEETLRNPLNPQAVSPVNPAQNGLGAEGGASSAAEAVASDYAGGKQLAVWRRMGDGSCVDEVEVKDGMLCVTSHREGSRCTTTMLMVPLSQVMRVDAIADVKKGAKKRPMRMPTVPMGKCNKLFVPLALMVLLSFLTFCLATSAADGMNIDMQNHAFSLSIVTFVWAVVWNVFTTVLLKKPPSFAQELAAQAQEHYAYSKKARIAQGVILLFSLLSMVVGIIADGEGKEEEETGGGGGPEVCSKAMDGFICRETETCTSGGGGETVVTQKPYCHDDTKGIHTVFWIFVFLTFGLVVAFVVFCFWQSRKTGGNSTSPKGATKETTVIQIRQSLKGGVFSDEDYNPDTQCKIYVKTPTHWWGWCSLKVPCVLKLEQARQLQGLIARSAAARTN